MSGALHARTDHASDKGWGVTGWDRSGTPRGMTDDGELTRDPFLYYLELRLRRQEPGACAVVRWAYLGWDTEAAANTDFVERIRLRLDDPDGWRAYLEGHDALLERTIRQLWHDCQREPVRWSICQDCRRRDCVCGQRSEAQIAAEDAA
jgi:hypothetical protein